MNKSDIQKEEAKKINKRLAIATGIKKKVQMAIDHNLRGQREGWFETEEDHPHRGNPYKISLSPYENTAKVSKSEFCYFDQNINLHYPSIEKQDVPDLIELLNTPKHWWREYEKINLWSVLNCIIGLPKEILFLEKTAEIKKDRMPSTDLLGKIVNYRGGPDLEIHGSNDIYYYKWVEAPKEFTELFRFCSAGFDNGSINEGQYYNTVRFGKVRSGAEDQFKFNLCLNGRYYEVELYGSDRGGSPYRPSHYEKDLKVRKCEAPQEPQEVHFTMNCNANNEVIFRNLARKLKANYPFSNSGVPIAGIE